MALLLCIVALPFTVPSMPPTLPVEQPVTPVEVIGRLTVTGAPDMDVTATTEVLLDGRPVEWGDSRLPTPRFRIRLAHDRKTVLVVQFMSDP